MFAALFTETLKLRRSLALLLCLSAPAMIAVLNGVILLDRAAPSTWSNFLGSGAAMWAFFMLPMTVTALTVLLAQIEHGPGTWSHLLALPIPRWRLFAAKAAVVLLLVAGMSLLLLALLPLAGFVVSTLQPAKLGGAFAPAMLARLLSIMFLGALLMIAIQLWAALRFRSFVPPLVIGIGGTFVAIAAVGSKWGVYFPWLIATNALATDPARTMLATSIGLIGGLGLLALMLADLSRREMA